MGVVRINTIGPGAVEYLLRGCEPVEPEAGPEPEAGQEPEGPGPERQREAGIGYFLDGHGEPQGRWLGSGMEGLGLSMRAGELAREDDLRAIFGELRYPNSERENSTREHPIYLGSKPRNYQTLTERVEAALKAEPDASAQRRREIELETARHTHSNVAYYDVTFSPSKSVSVYFAALLAAGDYDTARQVREAHDQAVRIAIESAEVDVAWTRTGRHGRASASGRTTGEWQKATGLSAVQFAHHTNRDGEPQLHAHVGVLGRVALADGRVYALDGGAWRPVKDAMAASYDRAFEAILSDLTGVVWVDRADGNGREIDGIDPALMEEASTRTREFVEPRIAELSQLYQERHGHEPGPRALRAIVDQAVKDTRRPKTGPAGPAAVMDWVMRRDGRAERLQATLDRVDEAVAMAAADGRPQAMATEYGRGHTVASPQPGVATPQAGVATPQAGMASGQKPVATGAQRVATPDPEVSAEARERAGERAVARGLAAVQQKYATWRIGALVREIDHALGPDVAAVGLGIDQRRAWVRGLAEAAVSPGAAAEVVQVSMGDPVPVPAELRREVDGRSRFRAHIDERYATADHLATEQRLVARAQAGGARSLDAETVGRIAQRAAATGLSPDQVNALAAVLYSDRRVEVLVGPAGAGKSHILAKLAEVWAAEHGGQVIGTATAQVAARNLTGLGMHAANTHALLAALDPDERGRVRMRLTERDLLVIDEAGMASTPDLDRLVAHAAAAGAKVVAAGDHRQLSAVEAGGMFAYLAERPGAIVLEQVHRFQEAWEREASLRLRDGDPTVAGVYADNGRMRAGSVEQMEYLASRDYLADRVEGVSSLLIVGSNAQAEQLSKDIQAQLVKLGMVDPVKLLTLPNDSELRRGDLIQARENDYTLRVDGRVDQHGRVGEALPVTNRELYTVVGYDADARALLAQDPRGAIAHLPEQYVAEHVQLAYAVTNHSAQGLTVQRGRPIANRGMTLEALYPAATRGREYNVLYAVTEIDPDAHHPQRVRDSAEAALVQILERREDGTDAALAVLEAGIAEARSVHTLAEHYDRVAAERGHTRHNALIAQHLGTQISSEPAYPALLGRLRAVELEGHDIDAVVAAAIELGSFRGAEQLSKVMHSRIGRVVATREPEHSREEVQDGQRTVRPAWAQLAEQHQARAAETGDRVEAYLATVAQHTHKRTEELGAEIAAAPPRWATEWLGAVPDPEADPQAHTAWLRDAAEIAAYREYRGIPDEQGSVGAAPPPAQQLAHELWTRAVSAGPGDPYAVDWRQASEAQLRETVARWERDQQNAPVEVSPERGEALALAHDAANDATLGRAQLAVMAPDDPDRERLEERVRANEVMAEHAAAFAASLEEGHLAAEAWWEQTRPQRDAATAAEAELERRGLTHPEPPEPDASPRREEPDNLATGDNTPAAARGQQQAFEFPSEQVTPETPAGADPAPDAPSERRTRFLDGLAAEHQRALDEVDPDRALDPEARKAAVRQRNYDRFVNELREQHGSRLDPEGQLSDLDLAHARARELAETNRREMGASREAGARANQPRRPRSAEQQPTATERTPDVEQARESDRQPEPEPTPGSPADRDREREPRADIDVTTSPAPDAEPHGPAGLELARDLAPEAGPEPVLTAEPECAAEPERAAEPEVNRERDASQEAQAELRRAGREDRAARITGEAAAARWAEQQRAAEKEREPEPMPTAEFDREASLDDELAARRHRERGRELGRERELDPEREIDD